MIKDAFELEGLLLLADSRGEEASQLLIDAIREKSESLASAAASLEISGGGEVEEDSNLSDFCTGGETSGDDSCIVAAEEEETPEEVEESVPESEEEAEEQPAVPDDEVLLESDGDFMEEQEDEDAADEEPSGENTTSEDVAGDGGAHGDEGRIRTEAQHAAGRVIGVHIDRLGERALRPGFRQPPQRITRFPECEPLQFKRCLVITAPARRRQRCRRISHRRIKFFLRNFHPDSLPVPLSYYSILTVDCKYCGMWGE